MEIAPATKEQIGHMRRFWDETPDKPSQRLLTVPLLKRDFLSLLARADAFEATVKNVGHLASLMSGKPTDRHTLTYTNWRGETSERELHLVRIWWGETEWHPEPQLLLSAFDYEKDAYRDFAINDFSFQADIPTTSKTKES